MHRLGDGKRSKADDFDYNILSSECAMSKGCRTEKVGLCYRVETMHGNTHVYAYSLLAHQRTRRSFLILGFINWDLN